MQRFLTVLCLAACAQAAVDGETNALAEFSGALERLAAKVGPAVVQVQVSAWCAADSPDGEGGATLSACKVVGSGVIVDPSGYILTNEHVVRNARHIRVMLTPRPDPSGDGVMSSGKPQVLDSVIIGANREPLGKREVLDATVVGTSRETDLALLKIEASGLPVIPLQEAGAGPRQGQVALAVGSPEGLDNTMTIGIISAVGRQPLPDYPMLYIQTDAAINPGNSGGPLLNAAGELIGINTFIFGESGRNQGLGFAVPAGVVRYVYGQLRSQGVVRHSMVGVRVQTVTPGLAQGLGLSRGYGVMISDVLPGSPAEDAGLKPRDIIAAIDGASISALPYYTATMYLHDPTVPVAITVLRGQDTLQFQVPAMSADDKADKDSSIDPIESPVPELGIFGKSVNVLLAFRKGLRSHTGVYVAATTAGNDDSGIGLAAGDVIASVNGKPIEGMQDLHGTIRDLIGGKAAVLRVERNGQFVYIEEDFERRPAESGSALIRH
jgi:serine protease Do